MVDTFLQPLNIEDACACLKENEGKAKALAGGTDLLNSMRSGKVKPEVLVDLSRIDSLKGILIEDGEVRIGALTTMTEVEKSEVIREFLPAIGLAAGSIGATQTRNRASVGGNIVQASPGADLLSALTAFDTKVVLAGVESVRELEVSGFVKGPNKTEIAAGEILTQIKVVVPEGKPDMVFKKLSRRNASSISLMNITCSLGMEGKVIREARVAMGALLPTARRFNEVEKLLEDETSCPELFMKAGQVAVEQVLSQVAAADISSEELGYEYKLAVLPKLVYETLCNLCVVED
jgi:CO/xanthine dehydrogenase FAD-binding subunit